VRVILGRHLNPSRLHRVIDRLRVGTCPLGDQLQASHLPELAVRGAVEFVDQATGADQVLGLALSCTVCADEGSLLGEDRRDGLFHWTAALPSSPFRAIGIGCTQHLVRIAWEDTRGSPLRPFGPGDAGCRGASPNGQLDQGIEVGAFGTQLSGVDE